jgi:hypothetical protein
MNPTIKKIILFLGIILIGIIGLMVADQYDFINGRTDNHNTIGNGVPDPLVNNQNSDIQTIDENKKNPVSSNNTVLKKPSAASVPNIDGVQKNGQ